MTHKHIISAFVLMSVVIPTAVFAETPAINKADKNKLPKAEIIKNTTSSESVQNNNSLEKEKDKNRKQRISFAINAIDQNISIVEKSLKQIHLRLDGVDQNSNKIPEIKNELTTAEAKLTEAKKLNLEIRESVKTINTTDNNQINELRLKINDTKKDISDSIKSTKKAVQMLKTIKVVKPIKEVQASTTKAK